MNTPDSAPSQDAHLVHCRMQAEEAAMERLLQVVRIRGFQLRGLQLERDEDGYRIALTLAGERPIDFLLPQLRKLHSIRSVEAAPWLSEAAALKSA